MITIMALLPLIPLSPPPFCCNRPVCTDDTHMYISADGGGGSAACFSILIPSCSNNNMPRFTIPLPSSILLQGRTAGTDGDAGRTQQQVGENATTCTIMQRGGEVLPIF